MQVILSPPTSSDPSRFISVCRTVTSGGSDCLAVMLSAELVECGNFVADDVETFDAEIPAKERIDKRADIFTLTDWCLLRSFAKWQTRLAHDMDRWIVAVGQMDVLVLMANSAITSQVI